MIRLEEALDAIVRQLDRHGLVVDVGPDHAIRVRAAKEILDRTGMGPQVTQQVNVAASEPLVKLMRELDGREAKEVENEAMVAEWQSAPLPTVAADVPEA